MLRRMEPLTRRDLLAGTAALGTAQAQQPAAGRLNLIVITVDTWGTHYYGCYGNTEIRTPSVDGLARKSAMFLDAFPEVLPTIPVRRSLYTGRRIFPSQLVQQPDDQVRIRGWHQMYAEDVTMSEALQAAGYTTAIVSDVYHQFKPGKNFHRGFDSWRFVRGQESDRLESGPRKAIDLARYTHASQTAMRNPKNKGGIMQYLLNRREWKSEEDWLASQVFREAGRWLENAAAENQPFYLHIESFSPHEYWDPPQDYYRLYMKGDFKGPWMIQPPATTAAMSPIEVEHVRAMYAGFVTFTDSRIGKFLRRVESLGLAQNTFIVFVADHGTMMGEQGQLHKGETRLRTQVTNVPLLMHHPSKKWEGRRIRGFVQHTDVMPTILDALGVAIPSRVTGESLLPLIESGRDSKREGIITGWGEHASVRTPEWNYIGRWSPGNPFQELYDVKGDPQELKNVAVGQPRVVKEFHARLMDHVNQGWSVTKGTFSKVLESA
jgi:arylsulfatase A-like enzyme